jgi:hypothetical protein
MVWYRGGRGVGCIRYLRLLQDEGCAWGAWGNEGVRGVCEGCEQGHQNRVYLGHTLALCWEGKL